MRRYAPLFATAIGLAAGTLLVDVAHAVVREVPGTYTMIQDAIDASVDGDVILVDDGTYDENVTIDKNVTVVSVNGRAVTTIEGMSGMGALGAVRVASGSDGVQIGDVGQGFTIVGVDNGDPAIENAAIYLQGAHTNLSILDNEVVANGEAGLLSEYGASISDILIDGNTFSGQTFVGQPAGDGFGSQFTLANVPRQLVTLGCGAGCTTATAVTFTNNQITGIAGGMAPEGNEQGNTLVTIDAEDAVVTGNTFAGTTTRFATSLRTRGPNTTITGNVFDASGLASLVGHVYLQSIGTSTTTAMGANTFDRAVTVDAAIGTIGHVLQVAIDASPGGTLLDLTGLFTEQVVVDAKNLILQGSGTATTTIASPASLAIEFGTNNRPILAAMNTASVEVHDLTVDGQGNGNGNNRFIGIAFWNAGGAVLGCVVENVVETPFSGVQHGIGIYSFNDTGGPYALEVGGTTIDTFQKNAFALSGAGMTVDVHDCDVVGAGDTAVTAQNGIQIGFGAGGTVTACSVSEMRYSPADFVASGLLVYQATTVDVDGLTLTNIQQPVYYIDAGGDLDGVDVSNAAPIVTDYGALAIANNTTPTPLQGAVASPFAEAWDGDRRQDRAFLSVTLSNGCLMGTGVGDGVYASSASEPLSVTLTNMTVSGWETALVADGAAVSLDAGASAIVGNVVGYDNSASGNLQDATGNWWGAADGPSGSGPGSGDSVEEGGFPGTVAFAPFLTDGTSTTGCAFTPVGSTVTATPDPADCISGPMPCLSVPFEIDRGDTDDMRAYSVTFTLSPELELCAGVPGSITEGAYLSDVGGTAFQVVDNGGGSYTVDCAILGTPCGQTDDTGTLFEVDVTTSGTDGTGTITVTEVLARNCDNVPLPSAPGSVATITIDTTAPTAVADLASAQVTTSNPPGNTTGITVSFSAPGDAAVVEVYRKGFGFYPEYDDAGGAVPTIPATPAAAVTDGWTLTGVTTPGEVDDPGSRDFWYYVVFTEDACANVSPASNLTAGSLSYHLGDVAGGGDNAVTGLDISALGGAYGTIDGDAFYDPTIDVGPTTDFSTLTRPTTDDLIGFEDLLMFAINHGEVSRELPPVNGGPRPYLELVTEVSPGGERVASLVLHDAAGQVKGLQASIDLRGLEVVDVQVGSVLLSPDVFWKHLDRGALAVIDAATLRTGSFGVDGEVVRLVLAGPAGQRPVLVHQDLRDVANRFLADSPVSGGGEVPVVPSTLRLVGARPNPFRTETAVRFDLPEASRVSLSVYDVHGRRVRELVRGDIAAGVHAIAWDGRDDTGRRVSAGVYFSRLAVGSSVATEKIYRQ
jgi:hypothetical protein